jgi:hypothetical protein
MSDLILILCNQNPCLIDEKLGGKERKINVVLCWIVFCIVEMDNFY